MFSTYNTTRSIIKIKVFTSTDLNSEGAEHAQILLVTGNVKLSLKYPTCLVNHQIDIHTGFKTEAFRIQTSFLYMIHHRNIFSFLYSTNFNFSVLINLPANLEIRSPWVNLVIFITTSLEGKSTLTFKSTLSAIKFTEANTKSKFDCGYTSGLSPKKLQNAVTRVIKLPVWKHQLFHYKGCISMPIYCWEYEKPW